MPKQFQPIPVHGFQEISLHHFHPFLHFLHICGFVSICFMGRCIWVIVMYLSSFSRFRCLVSKKLTPVIFNHFQFFSISVHPLTTILLWEVHKNDRSMLIKFQVNPIYRLGAMEKTSCCLVKIQHQQHKGANLNVEAGSCSVDPAKGYPHQKISHVSANRPECIHRI